jgi:hypothetical protein
LIDDAFMLKRWDYSMSRSFSAIRIRTRRELGEPLE